ncbi:group III truncated hemoglobin [Nisaea acidiphila]|uniref:Group III truncated hemoglobin n=1 Tax=Nisaea acidiphila TaxID=1862145 RepID=A0A9J7AWZ5_9PROT|nr:group III truncated hemoglobin [Nisaea acidiphila]UUX51887.1 group III truncated hemoglobin [Nisaea acidiphila]
MNTEAIRSAPGRRAEIRAQAEALGVNEAYIDLLVEVFYRRIRQDEVLGPVFARRISDWSPHLARMKSFWGSVALNSGQYSGKPVPAHLALKEVRSAHFERWLALFQATLEDTAPTPGAVAYFMERAQRIATSLQLAMFGVPELRGDRGEPQ